MKMTKHCLSANMHKDQPYGPLRGICSWIMWFCYLMMNYKSQACEWTLNISLEHLKKKFNFLELLYLFIIPNSAKKYIRNTNYSIFSLEKCSKTPKPGQLKHFPSTEILYLFIIPNSAKKYNWNTYPSIFFKRILSKTLPQIFSKTITHS